MKFFIPLILLSLPCLVLGASLHVLQPLDFGEIITGGAGGEIRIHTSGGQPAMVSTSGGLMRVVGAGAGCIRMVPDAPGQQIQIAYPHTVELRSGAGKKMYLKEIEANSSVRTSPWGYFLDIGGVLEIPAGASGSYAGSAVFFITVHNP